jgi:metallo-beta-lactamase class B
MELPKLVAGARAVKLIIALLALTSSLGGASRALAQPTPAELAASPALFLETARKALQWDEPAPPARIAGPIYFVGTKGLSVFLITTSEGLIVVNTGMPGSGPLIEASIRQLGFNPADIKILLAGHAHVDHVGGHAYLQKLSGAQVAMLRQEQELIESGGRTDFFYGNVREFAFEPAKVDRVLEDGEVLKLGGFEITALLTPGHTQGSTTFTTTIDVEGQTYNVVFPNGTSVNPGYRVAENPSYPGIGDDYRRTYAVLEKLKPDIWLHPHNETYKFEDKLARAAAQGAKAWVDPVGYRQWLIAQRQAFDSAD